MSNHTEDLDAAVEAAALLDNDALVAAAAESVALIEESREWDSYYAEMDTDYWSPVEQGFYDDDPSPYNGDYSEM